VSVLAAHNRGNDLTTHCPSSLPDRGVVVHELERDDRMSSMPSGVLLLVANHDCPLSDNPFLDEAFADVGVVSDEVHHD